MTSKCPNSIRTCTLPRESTSHALERHPKETVDERAHQGLFSPRAASAMRQTIAVPRAQKIIWVCPCFVQIKMLFSTLWATALANLRMYSYDEQKIGAMGALWRVSRTHGPFLSLCSSFSYYEEPSIKTVLY